jgi:hypothetical protein
MQLSDLVRSTTHSTPDTEGVDLDYVEAIKARAAGTSEKYRSDELPEAPKELDVDYVNELREVGDLDGFIDRVDDWTLANHEVIGYEAELRQDKALFETTSGLSWWGHLSPSGFGTVEPKALGGYRRKSKPMPDNVVVTVLDTVDPDEVRDKPVAEFASKMRDNDTHLRYVDFVDAASMTLPSADDLWVDGVWQEQQFVLDTFGV